MSKTWIFCPFADEQ